MFHGMARVAVIQNVEPNNKLGVGGREFRVKRNPVGQGGAFVYDPRDFYSFGVTRNLVWWVPLGDVLALTAYPLNSPSKLVTPGLEVPVLAGLLWAPDTRDVLDYVFDGEAMPADSSGPSGSIPARARRLAAIQAGAPCTPTELSPVTVELVGLYEELHTFKDDVEELDMGFSQAGPYSAWIEAVEANRDRDKEAGGVVYREVGFMPGDVIRLSREYSGDFSVSDSAIEFDETLIQTGLALARCEEPVTVTAVQDIVRASAEVRRDYAEAEAERLAAPLSASDRAGGVVVAARIQLAVLERAVAERAVAERAAVLLSLSRLERAAGALGDLVREIEQRIKQEYGAALARFTVAVGAAERGAGTWAAALAEGETVLALATAMAAEMSAIATAMAALEAMAPPEVAAEVAARVTPSRMTFEQAVHGMESAVVELQDQLESMRVLMADKEATQLHVDQAGR